MTLSPEIACVVGLIVLFVVGTALPVNMGALAFVMAFVVGGLFVDMSAASILAGFPGDLFVTLVGITYLFAIAQNNGTIDWLVRQAVRSVRGRTVAIPWVMFFVTALLTSVGAVSPGAVAIIAPVALRFSQQYRINPLLMGLMVIHGAQGGGFSPMSVYGGITNQVVQRAELPGSDMHLFVASLCFNLVVAVVIFFVFGGRSLLAQRAAQLEPADAGDIAGGAAGGRRLTYQQVLTLIGLVALGVGALVFELNVGLVAIDDRSRADDPVPQRSGTRRRADSLVDGAVDLRRRHLHRSGAKGGRRSLRRRFRFQGRRTARGCAAALLRGWNRLGIRIHGRRARCHHSAGRSLVAARTDRRCECRSCTCDLIFHSGCESLLH